jgi:signal transduction histidine kinase
VRYIKISGMLSEASPAIRRATIVIIFFGLFLISSNWIGLYYKIQSERQMELDGAFKETANYARAFEEHTLRTVKGVDQIALFLEHEYEKEGSNINIARYVREGIFSNQPFMLLSIIDEDGELVSSSQVPFVPDNLKDREHFLVHRDHDSGQLFISKPVLGRSSGKWAIQMTRRINKPDGAFGGVVVVSIDPFYFSEFYKQMDLGTNSTITLVGRDGVVRARQSGSNVEIGQDMNRSVLLENISLGETGRYVSTSKIDGIKRVHSYRVLPSYPLAVSVGIEEEKVFRELNQRVVSYYWVAGMNTVVISLFISMLLVVTARQKQTEEELRQVQDNLEAEVGQRTQELFAANEELTAMNKEHIAMNEVLQHINQELQNEITHRTRIDSALRISRKVLIKKNNELRVAIGTVKQTQQQLIQQEKLASVGQLAAGVAHEINNPLSYVTGNVEALEQYFASLRSVIAQYQELRSLLVDVGEVSIKEKIDQITRYENESDLEFILSDLPALFSDNIAGLERMSKIVKGMRVFSHINQQRIFEEYDLNDGVESTLVVVHNEIKHHATVEKSLATIPAIEAVGSEINQVLLNIIVNAVQAIKAKNAEGLGLIKVITWHDDEFVYCAIEDNGIGIEDYNMNNIFNPFFTTKPVGQGTGMGLSISYDIIFNRHEGGILVESVPGNGTKFTLKLPIKQKFAGDECGQHSLSG